MDITRTGLSWTQFQEQTVLSEYIFVFFAVHDQYWHEGEIRAVLPYLRCKTTSPQFPTFGGDIRCLSQYEYICVLHPH